MVTATRPVYRIMFPGILLGVMSLVVLVILGNAVQVGWHFISFKWEYFAVALGFDLVHHLLRFLNQSFRLQKSGINTLSLWKRVKLFLSGVVLSTTPLRVSESYKSVWLSQASGIPLSTADSLQLVDRISDILSVLVLAAAGTLAFPAFWPFFLLVFMLFLATSLSFHYRSSGSVQDKLDFSFQNLHILLVQLRKSIGSARHAFSTTSIVTSLFLGVFCWLAQGAALYFILIGLGLEPGFSLVAIACLALAFSMLMGLISRLPGGLGVIELAMAAILTILLNFRPELAVAATVLFRLATFWIDLLFGILFWSLSSKTQGIHQETGRIVQG